MEDKKHPDISELFSDKTDYIRVIGFAGVISIAIGRIIGSGIFRTPNIIMDQVECTSLFFAVWIIAGFIMVLEMLCYAELVTMMPKAGAPYAFLMAAYNPLVAFLKGWAMFFVAETASIVAVSLVCSEYSSLFWKESPYAGIIKYALPLSIIWLLTLVNLFGSSLNEKVLKVFAAIKLIAVGIVISFCFSSKSGNASHYFQPFLPANFSFTTIFAVIASLKYAFFTYSGWEGATYTAEEVKDPKKTLPKSLFTSAAIIITLYLVVNAAYLYQLPVKDILEARPIAFDAMQAAAGNFGSVLIAVIVMISTFTNVYSQIFCKSRSWEANARSGIFFKGFANLHPKYKTPNTSLFYQAVCATILLIFSSFSNDAYKTLIDFFSFTSIAFCFLTDLAIIILRKKYPDKERPYKAWGYPYTIWILLVFQIIFLVIIFLDEPLPSLYGVLLTLTGLIYYYRSSIFKHKIKS